MPMFEPLVCYNYGIKDYITLYLILLCCVMMTQEQY